MKRFLLAAVLAFALHGILFWIPPAFFEGKPLPKTRKNTVSLDLTTRKAPASTPKTAPPQVQAPKPAKPPAAPPLPPRVEEVPTPEASEEQPVKEETAPLPPKKTLPPVKKAPTLPKKTAKPKKPVKTEKKPVKPVQTPKPVPPKPVKTHSESPPHFQDTKEAEPVPSKKPAKSDERTDQTLNLGDRKPVADAPPSSSTADGPEIETTEPDYKNNPSPDYPRRARRRGYAGTVVLKVLVSEKGSVMQVRVSTSSGYDILDRAAEESVEKWIFEPGTIAGKKVEMWVNVPIRFDLKSR